MAHGCEPSAAWRDVASGEVFSEASYVTDSERLQQMIDDLRRMREHCEPKSNQNPRYLRYSSAVSALRWIFDDLAKERAVHR